MNVISVIVGSTREGRCSEKPAKWIRQHLKKHEGVDARLLDLRDFPMPFFDQPATPAMPGRPPYKNEVVQKWTAAIAQSDGFVFVAPEYNYGPSAVLKNAIDWVYPEWNRKAAGFVSYGSAMGARGVQQLRLTAIEVELAPIRSSVHIPVATLWAHYQGGDVDAGLAEGGARRGDDRRSAVVDHRLEDGARQRVLISHNARLRFRWGSVALLKSGAELRRCCSSVFVSLTPPRALCEGHICGLRGLPWIDSHP